MGFGGWEAPRWMVGIAIGTVVRYERTLLIARWMVGSAAPYILLDFFRF